jgi:DNA polymerase III sliding clamp (beta) subunit (PCNA family)
MAKNSTKKAKFKPVVFEIQKSRFIKAIKNALNSTLNYVLARNTNCLTGINFKISGENLILASTDGNTLIKQELIVDKVITPGDYQLTLSGQHLYKANFKKSYEFGRKSSMDFMDKLKISLNEDFAIIEDLQNGIKYTIPKIDESDFKFPEYEKFIPDLDKNEKYTKIGFNTYFLARFAEISNPRNGVGILRVDKESPLSAILITSDNNSDEIKTTALLIPIQLRE